ncbi:MAG TPA: VWA domain-containing protein [Polyangia bacterium]|nr:VWA domain-containing protein [Polyangia bacterium]
MTLAGAPLGLLAPAFAVLGAAVVALYVLKLRRQRVEVPFADLWQKILRDTETTALWRKLRRLISLLLQLAMLALILGAIGDPHLSASSRGRTIVLLLDTSASMQATDGRGAAGTTRLAEAQEQARRLIRGFGAEDVAMVLSLDGRPAPISGFQSDDRELLRAVDAAAATDTPADLERALRLAADALRGRTRPTLVLLGDGAWDDRVLARVRLADSTEKEKLSTIDLRGVDVRFAPVGKSGDNVGITAFAVRRYRANQTAYEVLVEVQSFRDHASVARLELVQDGEVVNVERLELGAGERVERLYPNLAGEGTRLEARLRPESPTSKEPLDAFPVDDRAYALLPPRHKLKVELITAGNLFLEGALLLDENLQVEKLAPGNYDAAATAKYDAVVLDAFTPPKGSEPRTHALYLDPRGPASPFPVAGELDAPLVTEVAADHPLMRWVTLKDLNISHATRFALAPGDVAVAAALKQPIIAARERDGRKTVALGFDLRRSDLPMRVAFPVLVVNALDWFAGADTGLLATYATGQPWRLPAPPGASELAVTAPDGKTQRAPVHDGRASFYGSSAGYYQVSPLPPSDAPAAMRQFAANLASSSESRIAPRAELIVDGRKLPPPEPGRLGVRRSLWSYLILVALAIALVEWWTYNRRVTV